ncbi:MAG: hypothetical protein IJ890_05490 [Clostridia bacterium]|nr:hypothetical protein [Clostridia bacterium]
MYNKFDINDFDFKILQLQNNFYKFAIEQTDFILSIFKKWDNKKITKRILNELNNNDKNITFYMHKNSIGNWRLYFYCDKDSYCYGADKNGIDKTRRIKYNEFNYIYSYDKDTVNYEELEKIILEHTSYYKELIEKQKEILPDIEKRIANINCLSMQLQLNIEKLRLINDCYFGAYNRLEFRI